jgi:hypothetical protein
MSHLPPSTVPRPTTLSARYWIGMQRSASHLSLLIIVPKSSNNYAPAQP